MTTGEAPSPRLQARAEIDQLRAAGYGWADVARSLNARGIATPSGRGRWHPESVRRFLDPEPWAAYHRRYRARRARGRWT